MKFKLNIDAMKKDGQELQQEEKKDIQDTLNTQPSFADPEPQKEVKQWSEIQTAMQGQLNRQEGQGTPEPEPKLTLTPQAPAPKHPVSAQRTEQKDPVEAEKERILELLRVSLAEVTSPFRILMMGGDADYYLNIFEFFHEANPNIQYLKHLNGAGEKAYYEIDSLNPDLIIIHHATPVQSAVQFIQSLSRKTNAQNVLLKDAYWNKRILVIAPEDVTYELLLRQDLGVRFYIKEDISNNTVNIESFAVNIKNAYLDIQRQKQTLKGQEMPKADSLETVDADFFLRKQAKKVTRVIGIYSATGGSGKTMFVTNLAVVLGKYGNINDNESRVCLVEFTLGEKELDLFLNFHFDKNITGLARQVDSILQDKPENETKEQKIERKTRILEAIRNHMYHDDTDKIDVLLGTDAQYDYDSLSEEFVSELFTSLRQMYDIILVDFPTDMCRRQIILGLASMEEIYYICPMEVPAIRNAKTLINVFTSQYGFRKESIKMVVNKILPEQLRAFSRDEMEDHFARDGIQIVGELPWDEMASLSINKGEPLTRSLHAETLNLSNGATNYAEAVYDIATQINEMLVQPLAESTGKTKAKKVSASSSSSGKSSGGLFGKLTGALFSKKPKTEIPQKKTVKKKPVKRPAKGNLLRRK